MTSAPVRYNQRCSFKPCHRWRRSGDIFCQPCYKSLPKATQNSLWVGDLKLLAGNIILAKQLLQEKLEAKQAKEDS